MSTETPLNQRRPFIGRVTERRYFEQVVRALLAHQAKWRAQAQEIGDGYDPAYDGADDDSYARIFILHGIGGIGKTWLSRRLLANAEEQGKQAQLLTCYNDVSTGFPPVQRSEDLVWRLARWLEESGYEDLVAPCRQAAADVQRFGRAYWNWQRNGVSDSSESPSWLAWQRGRAPPSMSRRRRAVCRWLTAAKR